MRQAIHIFKKDARCLRFEIAMVVLLAGVFTVLWPIAAAYLIARVIHAEAIPGDNQFWITRPYRWTSLIASKLLFIALFLNLPVFLVQLYGLLLAGFPLNWAWVGLVWSQVLLVLAFLLPVAALAAITPGMIAFMFLELVTVMVVFGLGESSFFGFAIRRPWPTGVEWIPNSFLVSLAGAAAITVLLLQFRRRRTVVSRFLAGGSLLAGVAIYLFLPPQFALNSEASLTKSEIDSGSLQLRRANDPIVFSTLGQIAIPILLSGVQVGTEVKVDGLSGTMEGPDGRVSNVFTNGADTRVDAAGNVTIRAVLRVDRGFLKQERDQPVTLHASVFLSLFGDGRLETMPQQPQARTVMNQLRCSTTEFEKLVQFRCMSAFRWPGEMIYAEVPGKEKASFYESFSYSPFPAELNLSPFEFHTALGSRGLAPPSPLGPPTDPTVTIIAKRVMAHMRREVEIRDIRFSQPGDGIRTKIQKPR
jgi:hypothetical protein